MATGTPGARHRAPPAVPPSPSAELDACSSASASRGRTSPSSTPQPLPPADPDPPSPVSNGARPALLPGYGALRLDTAPSPGFGKLGSAPAPQPPPRAPASNGRRLLRRSSEDELPEPGRVRALIHARQQPTPVARQPTPPLRRKAESQPAAAERADGPAASNGLPFGAVDDLLAAMRGLLDPPLSARGSQLSARARRATAEPAAVLAALLADPAASVALAALERAWRRFGSEGESPLIFASDRPPAGCGGGDLSSDGSDASRAPTELAAAAGGAGGGGASSRGGTGGSARKADGSASPVFGAADHPPSARAGGGQPVAPSPLSPSGGSTAALIAALEGKLRVAHVALGAEKGRVAAARAESRALLAALADADADAARAHAEAVEARLTARTLSPSDDDDDGGGGSGEEEEGAGGGSSAGKSGKRGARRAEWLALESRLGMVTAERDVRSRRAQTSLPSVAFRSAAPAAVPQPQRGWGGAARGAALRRAARAPTTCSPAHAPSPRAAARACRPRAAAQSLALALDAAARELGAVLEASPAAIFSLSALGNVVGWNRAAAELTGWTRAQVSQRHFVEVLVPEPLQEATADELERAFAVPASDPLAYEPSDPFTFRLAMQRPGPLPAGGGLSAFRSPPHEPVVQLSARILTRRDGHGEPMGLLCMQQASELNKPFRVRRAAAAGSACPCARDSWRSAAGRRRTLAAAARTSTSRCAIRSSPSIVRCPSRLALRLSPSPLPPMAGCATLARRTWSTPSASATRRSACSPRATASSTRCSSSWRARARSCCRSSRTPRAPSNRARPPNLRAALRARSVALSRRRAAGRRVRAASERRRRAGKRAARRLARSGAACTGPPAAARSRRLSSSARRPRPRR